MRIWHKDLIAVLPDNQLRGQWRECCLIAKGLRDGTLNHLLVNKVKNYPLWQLLEYGVIVSDEMEHRGMNVNYMAFRRYFPENILDGVEQFYPLFAGWHNDRYLMQCYYNLQEKYDCGGISEDEWQRIEVFMHDRI